MAAILALIFSFIFFCSSSLGATITYNVLTMGAKPDGKTDSTKAVLTAWASACALEKPAAIYVPPGRYLLRAAYFGGKNCKNPAITLRLDGTLVAPSDYHVIGNAGSWLKFESVSGVSIYGGMLDGQGSGLWACKASGRNCPSGATTLAFYSSNNIVVNGLTSLNSQMFHIVMDGCHNAKLQAVKVSASGRSPNKDGIHLQSSSDVTILNSHIRTGDDCISIGTGNSSLWIENVSCGPGHGISIGSLGWDLQEPGVQNVTVKDTWSRESASNGFVKGVLFQNIVMVNVDNPVIIDQNYCPNHHNCPKQVSGVKISDVSYDNIHGTSGTQVAVKFQCSKEHPCSGIRLEDMNLTYKDRTAKASCLNADGTASGSVQPTSCL
ncbi:hypothetical protein RJ639_015037 [Escallonia herrerae]|uniref:Polygalacturonase n=1 Tax=Escallonia herrerae TaxID=1293975 RepID=A0AA89AL86_9ASTE|nr:hypothetical protein RJ639_015037 [Escallonia herrerae]